MKRSLPLLATGCLIASAAFADLPVPPQVYNPQTPAEAWNVIRLAMANANRLLVENRLQEITDQVALCSPALRTLSRFNPGADAQTVIAYRAINDVARTALSGSLPAAKASFSQLSESVKTLESAFPEADVRAEIFACAQHPEVLTTVSGSTCRLCSSPLRVRRIPYTEICPIQEAPVARLQVSSLETPVLSGQKVVVQAILSDSTGSSFPERRLLPLHGETLLFFVTDASLREFHLLRSANNAPGPFELSFVPQFPGPHRIWAGLVPEQTGLAEYPWANLESDFQVAADAEWSDVVTAPVEGYLFSITFSSPGGAPAAKELSLLRLHVTNPQGQPCSSLEPLDRAFAHLTGFFDDGETVIRLHPLGPDILREDLRGGPGLAFKIYPPRAGYLRLFCQIKVAGKILTAPLGIRVK